MYVHLKVSLVITLLLIAFDMYGIDFGGSGNTPPQTINNTNSSFKEHQMHNVKLTEIDSISNNLPETEMKDRVDMILKKWTIGVSDQPKNLLMILSTLKEVWSKDPKLHDISLKELVDDPSLASKTPPMLHLLKTNPCKSS